MAPAVPHLDEPDGPAGHAPCWSPSGIGTQALGLAAAGYDVLASDTSSGAIDRLRREATRRQLTIEARVADLRTLSASWHETFAAILACDNVLPHLLTDNEIARALAECRRCLRPGGALIASVRDYALIERRSPDVRPYSPHTEGARRYSAEQAWEWDGDRYDLTMRLTEEAPGEEPHVHLFHTAYSSCSSRKDLPASNDWMAYSSSRSLSESRRDAHAGQER